MPCTTIVWSWLFLLQVAQYEVMIVKYAKDVRYDDCGIATHDRQTLPAVSATLLSQLTKKAEEYDVIGLYWKKLAGSECNLPRTLQF